MSSEPIREFLDRPEGDNLVPVDADRLEELERKERRYHELDERISAIEDNQERNNDVTGEYRGDGERQFLDFWLEGQPIGKILDDLQRRSTANEKAIEELRNNPVTRDSYLDVESLLPIQRLHQIWRADPDRLGATERRAVLVWDNLDHVTTKRFKTYAFDSKDVTDLLAGADENTSRATAGRVIDELVSSSGGIITKTTGPNGRILAEVDKSAFSEKMDEVRDEVVELEGGG